jgi:hypothetical protein
VNIDGEKLYLRLAGSSTGNAPLCASKLEPLQVMLVAANSDGIHFYVQFKIRPIWRRFYFRLQHSLCYSHLQPLSGHTNTEVKKKEPVFSKTQVAVQVLTVREPIVVSIGRHAAKEESTEEIDVTILEVYGRNRGQEHGVSIY